MTGADIVISSHGSILLFHPKSQEAREWLHDTAPEDALWHGLALAVERRYANDVAIAAVDAGLTLGEDGARC